MNLKEIGLGVVLISALIAHLSLAPSLVSLAPSLAAIEPHHTMQAAVLATSVTPQSAFTIAEFCRRNAISRSMFYKIRALGRGPRLMLVGTHIRISIEAEADWKCASEAEAATKSENQIEATT